MPRFDAQVDVQVIPVKNFVVEVVSADPATNLVEGRVVYRSDTKEFRVYRNATWRNMLDTGSTINPNGAAGGALTGNYPNPTLAVGAVSAANQIANSIITDTQVAAANKDGVTSTPSLRTLGTGAQQALAGNTRLDQLAAPTAAVSLNLQKITNLAAPTAATDAATMGYVDSVAQGLDAKQSVRAATTANVNVTAGASPNTLDGVTLVAGDRILVKNQTAPAENGIYTVTTAGTGANGTWARAADMDTWAEVPGAFTFVEEGTTQSDTGWVSTANANGTLGTTALPWTQFSSAGSYIGGNGLTLTGLTFDVNVDGVGIEINADILRLKDLGVTTAKIADNAVTLTSGAGQKVTGTLPVANGGTGGTTAAAARAGIGAAVTGTVASPTLTAGVYAPVVHGLGVQPRLVQFIEVSTGERVELDWRYTSGSVTTSIDVRADIGRAASYYTIDLVG